MMTGPAPCRMALVTSSLMMRSASSACSPRPQPNSALRACSRAWPGAVSSRPRQQATECSGDGCQRHSPLLELAVSTCWPGPGWEASWR